MAISETQQQKMDAFFLGGEEKEIAQVSGRQQKMDAFFGIGDAASPEKAYNTSKETQKKMDDFFKVEEPEPNWIDNTITSASIGNKSLQFDFDGKTASHIGMLDPSRAGEREEQVAKILAARKQFRKDIPQIESDNWAESTLYALAGMAPAMAKGKLAGVGTGIAGAGAAMVAGNLTGLGAVLPEEILTGPAGYHYGSKIGEINYWREQGQGGLYLDLREEGIDHDVAMPISEVAGLLYGLIEHSQLGKITGGKAITSGASKKFAKQAVINTLLSYAGRVAEETAEESLQGVVMQAAQEYANLVDPDKKDPKFWETMGRLGETAVKDAKESVSPLMVLSLIGLPKDIRRSLKLKKDAQNRDIVDGAAADQIIKAQKEAKNPPKEEVVKDTEGDKKPPQANVERVFSEETPEVQEKAPVSEEYKAKQVALEYEMIEAGYSVEDASAKSKEVAENKMDEAIKIAGEAAADNQAQKKADFEYIANTEMVKAMNRENNQESKERDPIKAFKGFLPKLKQYAGRGSEREVAKPVYVGGKKGDPLPGEYKGIRRAGGLTFTTDPSKGIPLDTALDEFNSANPGFDLTEDSLRDQLRGLLLNKKKKTTGMITPPKYAPQKEIEENYNIYAEDQKAKLEKDINSIEGDKDFEAKKALKVSINNVKNEIWQIKRKLERAGETVAAHNTGSALTSAGVAEFLLKDSLAEGKKYLALAKEDLDLAKERLAARKSIYKPSPSFRKRAEQLGIQLAPELKAKSEGAMETKSVAEGKQNPNRDIPLEESNLDGDITFMHGGLGFVSSAKMRELSNKVVEMLSGVPDWFKYALDIESSFKKINASATGFAFKMVGSWDLMGEKKGELMAKDLIDAAGGVDAYKKNKAHLLFVAEGSVEAKTDVEKNFKEQYKSWMEEAYGSLKENDILTHTFKERVLADVNAEIDALIKQKSSLFIRPAIKQEINTKMKELLKLRVKINQAEYVPLSQSVRLAFERKLDENNSAKESISKLFNSGGGNFADFTQIKGRKTLFAKDLYDSGFLTDDDLDPIKQAAIYSKYVYGKIGQKKVVDAAMKDGLIINAAKRGVGKALGAKEALKMEGREDWVKIPATFNGQEYYAAPEFSKYFNDYMNAQFGAGWNNQFMKGVAKLTAFAKMRQFFNPAYLSIMDIIQGFQSGIYTDPKIAKYAKEAQVMIKNKDAAYWAALENGLLSTPNINPMSTFSKEIDKILENHITDANTSIMTALQGIAKNSLKYEKSLRQNLKGAPAIGAGKNILTVAEDTYTLSWNVAWKGDEFFRFITYNELLDRGFDPKEAAQEAALIHGDYAGVPPKTRKALNIVAFTPTFQIAMSKWYVNMFQNLSKQTNRTYQELVKGETITRSDKEILMDQHNRRKAITLASIIIGKHLLVKSLGARTITFSRRYAFESETDTGQKKEVIQVFAAPFNVPIRFYERFAAPWIDPTLTTGEKFKKTKRGAMSMANPLWQFTSQLQMNRRSDGLAIYNEFDSPAVQAMDILQWTASQLYPLGSRAKATILGEDLYGSAAANKEVVENAEAQMWLEAMSIIAFAYSKDLPKAVAGKKALSITNRFKSTTREEMMQGDPKLPDRIDTRKKNLKKKVAVILGDKPEKGTIDLGTSFWNWFDNYGKD